MRTVTIFAALASVTITGCMMPWDKAKCGYTFTIHKPPVINTESQVLVAPTAQGTTASPLGTVSGPVIDGQFQQGVPEPLGMPKVEPRPKNVMHHDPCIPAPGGTRLTIEEWRRICDHVGRTKMPVGQE